MELSKSTQGPREGRLWCLASLSHIILPSQLAIWQQGSCLQEWPNSMVDEYVCEMDKVDTLADVDHALNGTGSAAN